MVGMTGRGICGIPAVEMERNWLYCWVGDRLLLPGGGGRALSNIEAGRGLFTFAGEAGLGSGFETLGIL